MRPEKPSIVEDLKLRVQSSPYVLIVGYVGMTVPQFNELRNRLATFHAELHVVKNTLLRRALAGAELPTPDDDLRGQTAVVTGEGDVTAACKVLKNFRSEFSLPEIRCGVLDHRLITAQEIMALADLPSREVLLGQLLGLINQPAATLVRMIQTPAAQIAQVVRAYAEKEAG